MNTVETKISRFLFYDLFLFLSLSLSLSLSLPPSLPPSLSPSLSFSLPPSLALTSESWEEGVPRTAYSLLRACGSEMILETTASRMDLTEKMWAEFQKKGLSL